MQLAQCHNRSVFMVWPAQQTRLPNILRVIFQVRANGSWPITAATSWVKMDQCRHQIGDYQTDWHCSRHPSRSSIFGCLKTAPRDQLVAHGSTEIQFTAAAAQCLKNKTLFRVAIIFADAMHKMMRVIETDAGRQLGDGRSELTNKTLLFLACDNFFFSPHPFTPIALHNSVSVVRKSQTSTTRGSRSRKENKARTAGRTFATWSLNYGFSTYVAYNSRTMPLEILVIQQSSCE